MASVFLFVFFVLSHFVLLLSAQEEEEGGFAQRCPEFHCRYPNVTGFPFTNMSNPECGVNIVDCQVPNPMIKLNGGRPYEFLGFFLNNSTIRMFDNELWDHMVFRRCESLTNLSFPNSSFISFEIITPNQTFFKCKSDPYIPPPPKFKNTSCRGEYNIYYSDSSVGVPSSLSRCSIIQLPKNPSPVDDTLVGLITAKFDLQVNVSEECKPNDEGKLYCGVAKKESRTKQLAIGLGVGCSAIFIIICSFFIMRHHYKKKYASSNMLAKNANSDPSSRSDLEGGSIYYGVPVYSYCDLEKATNNFDTEKELGDGGFGIVYYGKLRDGREVAVKRLYEHNYRQVTQFMNEVEILTRLRHKNLVSLYGCTSHRSRQLLLVYEYIPNGTVADHIHGERATPGSLTWPTRMSIAIETATALAYLHASEIIHRDVKTNNILLDNNFCVKVADFGLSRLFPNDISHVSTAPQGTPGYLDPEYHQCYQVTTKSDVYSFGVVLIELISSLPAVDLARHRHEINLANLAINKIEKSAFHELIDPHLGFESDKEVERMTILVAQLAFHCIQLDKETRPSMDEVLEALKQIQSGNDAPEDQEKGFDDDVIVNVKPSISP
ncbi:LEAF RUST 10 DISEASE-RESISTANCE LOCUS RECEPTOR-LIKE PROTEIN KINASE-like 1.1 [Corylus avellana]|uniref:LEAF RUST 10 DISEASE-RESISTANCE LOCUS RECEPTOR-LIKE PROTEIN KINASE-like 1.1 n=1 Tax=Corylus avellana TaxID=13451 RepID=UPI001E215E9F|nr:LEAF RUST 10 DISEASE-RESISTANCE LOCUS RECEPTOR-LIKE PROTEIN KINASE-like 1.1 [Corylus avellana]